MRTRSLGVYLLGLLASGYLVSPQNLSGASGPPAITSQPSSVTVIEGSPATFSVGLDGTQPFTYQWFRNGQPIDTATNSSYSLPVATVGDNGAVFRVSVNNGLGSATSSNALLTVNRDLIAPIVVDQSPPAGATVHALTAVEVFFSEQVTGVDASDLLVNGIPATELISGTPSQYKFLFPQPNPGTVQITWAAGHGIHDLAANPNNFAGAGWSYTLDTNVTVSVVINEFLASNKSGLRDEDGSYSDWIELYNAGVGAVNLAGWSLTDIPGFAEWQFPNVTLLPNSYLVVFASGKNKTDPAGKLHTNFQLNKGGEYLALFDANTNVVSAFAPSYPQQFDDVSYGRDRLNLDLLGYFSTPTPGAANSTGGPGFAPDVQFSRPSGTFTNAFSLALSTPGNTNAVIRYVIVNTATTAATTNIPTTNSPIYSGPIIISNTAQVRARSFLPNPAFFPGASHTEAYIMLSNTVVNFTSDLPLIVIHTVAPASIPTGAPTPDASVIFATFERRAGRASLTDQPQLVKRAGLNIRGSSTQGYPKSSWALELWDEFNQDDNAEVLGMPAESDWVLYAPNHFDRVLLHNPVAYEVSNEFGRYASRTRLVEVFFVNGAGPVTANFAAAGTAMGNYNGVYVLEEKVKRNKNRVDVEALEPENTNAPAITGGYMLKIDRQDTDERSITAGNQGMIWVYPDGPLMDTPQRAPQKSYVTTYFNSFYSALTTGSWTNPTTGYTPWIDVDSWIDHNMLGVLTLNADWLRLSGYFYKNRSKGIEMGPIWDHDRSQGTGGIPDDQDWRAFSPRYWTGGAPLGVGGTDYGTDFFNANNVFGNPWYLKTFQDPNFWQHWIDRYQGLRQSALATNNVVKIIDGFANEVRLSQVRELSRWSNNGASDTSPRRGAVFYSGAGLRSPFTNVFDGTYQGEVDFLKKWWVERLNFIDTNFLNPPLLVPAGGGMVSTGSTVALVDASLESGSTLYYTLDGSDPRALYGGIAANALAFNGPITISDNIRIMARAYNPTHRNVTGPNNPPISSPWSGPVAATYVVRTPPLRITELMYHPAPPPAGNTNDADGFEYVELKNISSTPLSLNRFRISGGINLDFPNIILTPGQSGVIVANVNLFQSRYGTDVLIIGQYTNNLGNGGDHLVLEGPLREPILDFEYSDGWYPTTDGNGFSLVIVNENAPLNTWGLKSSWRPSAALGGSPAQNDPVAPNIPAIVVNEVLTHTDLPVVDAVELYNPTANAVDISGWFLTDNSDKPLKYRIPTNTVLSAGGFVVFNENQFNTGPTAFSFSSKGDSVYLFSGNGTNITGYVHGFDFGAQANGVTFGRYVISTGSDHFVAQTANTLGTPNSGPLVGPVVIAEIMYHPPEAQVGVNYYNNPIDEYIELHNFSDSAAPLYDPANPTNTWRLRDAVDFDFPTNTSIPPHSFILVTSLDPANTAALADFRARNGVPAGLPIFGPFSGELDNSGDSVELQRPDAPEPPGSPDAGFVPYILVERVKYGQDSPWPPSADGLGPSLHRVSLTGYGNDPSNWVAAVRSPGAAYAGGTPPTITVQPISQTVPYGTNVTMSVSVQGSGPFSFQWQFNGHFITGATSSNLVYNSVQGSHSGQYQVVVQNSAGAALSTEVTLGVILPIVITQQPVSQNVRLPDPNSQGPDITLGVVASSVAPIQYQWRYNGANIPGATSPLLVLPHVVPSQSGDYTAVVNDGYTSATSTVAKVKIYSNFNWRFASLTGNIGATSNTIGTNLLIYMQSAGEAYVDDISLVPLSGPGAGVNVLTNGDFEAPLSGGPWAVPATMPGSTITNTYAHSGTYSLHVVATNGGSIANSIKQVLPAFNTNIFCTLSFWFRTLADSNTLNVRTFAGSGLQISTNVQALDLGPSIASQPRSIAVPEGGAGIFSVLASGSEPFSYQWLKDGTNLANGGKISGATSATLTVSNAGDVDTGSYSVKMSNALGSTNSASATLTLVAAPPAITQQPPSQQVPCHANATFTVGVSGSRPLSYQWRFNGNAIVNETNASLTLANVSPANNGPYSVSVSNSLGSTNSSAATLVVADVGPPSLSAQRDRTNLIVTWTRSCTTYQLQETQTLNPPAWSPTGIPPQDTQMQSTVTIPITSAKRFYRLKNQ